MRSNQKAIKAYDEQQRVAKIEKIKLRKRICGQKEMEIKFLV